MILTTGSKKVEKRGAWGDVAKVKAKKFSHKTKGSENPCREASDFEARVERGKRCNPVSRRRSRVSVRRLSGKQESRRSIDAGSQGCAKGKKGGGG